jgi:hypothetical protein
MAKKNLGELFRKQMGIVSTDADRAKALKKALKHLDKAQDLIMDGLPGTDYRLELQFELNRVIVDLEQNLAYYRNGELDPIR